MRSGPEQQPAAREAGVHDGGGARLADDAARVALSRVVTSCIDLVSVVLLVHLLVKEDVAAFAFVLVAYETAKHFATFGFPDSILYFFERLGRSAHRGFALQTAALLSLSGLTAAAALMVLQAMVPWMLAGWGPEALARVGHLLPFFAFVVLLEVPTWPTANILIARGRSGEAARWQLASSLLLFAALFGPLVAGVGPEGVAWALVVYAVVRFVGSALWVHRALDGPRDRLPDGMLREQFRFALPLGVTLLANRVNKYIDKIVVAVLLTDLALAEYQVGAHELPVVTVIPYAVGALLVGRFVALQAAGNASGLRELWLLAVRKVSLLVLPVAVFAIAMAQDIIALLFGDDYQGAVPVFQLYGLILLQRVAQYGAVLQARADTRGILRITCWMLVANGVLSVPMTLWMGIVGTATATVMASALGWVLYQHRIARHLELPVGAVLPWRHYLGVLGLSAGVAGGVSWLRHECFAQWSPGVALVVTGLVHTVLVVLVLRCAGLASAADLRAARRWMGPGFLFR